MKNSFGDISKEEVDEFYRNVSKKIKKIRLENNLSQLDVALKLGIRSVAFYSNCENNKYGKHFNLEHIYRLSKIFDIDICDLI